MPRFAAIDVGSNAMRLRVVEANGPRDVREVAAERAPIRLGRDVFLTGRLAPAALAEALDALKHFREVMRAEGVDAYRAVATSAVREAQNADVLVERASREAGVKLDVIEGVEEARLVLVAVLHAVRVGARRALLIDIGGGSVELTTLAEPAARASVQRAVTYSWVGWVYALGATRLPKASTNLASSRACRTTAWLALGSSSRGGRPR